MIKKIALNDFLGGYYHQDVWEDNETDKEVWKDYLNTHSEQDIKKLLEDIKSLESLADSEIKSYLEENSTGGLYFEHKEDSRRWLVELKKCFLQHESKN